MWEQVKPTMVGSARGMYVSVRVKRKSPKSVCQNGEVKVEVERKDCWELMMRLLRKDVLKLTNNRKIKRCTYKSKREVN